MSAVVRKRRQRPVGVMTHPNGTRLSAIDLDTAIGKVLERLAARGSSRNTLAAYGADLAGLQAYMADMHRITLIGLVSERHIEGWLDELAGGGNSARTCARKLSAARTLFARAKLEAWTSHDPTEAVRVKFTTKRVIAPEMDALLRLVDSIKPIGRDAVRDRAMIRLMLDAGLRVGALCALDVADDAQSRVDLGRRLVHIEAKGGGVSTLPIDDATVMMLRDWMKYRSVLHERSPALFLNSHGKRFTRDTVRLMLRRRGAVVGLAGLRPHLLRHRRIGQVFETVGATAAQHLAQHKHLSTTMNTYGAHAEQVLHQTLRERGGLPAGAAP
jgi:site-specific recombinase XerD